MTNRIAKINVRSTYRLYFIRPARVYLACIPYCMMFAVDADEGRGIKESTLLKALLKARHWQKRDTFAQQWDNVAKLVDSRLVGSCPGHAQFYRWLGGKIRGMPNPDACRILEAMFPGLTVQQLFRPTHTSVEQLRMVATFVTHTSSTNSSERRDSCYEQSGPTVDAINVGHSGQIMQPGFAPTSRPNALLAYPMRGLISRPKWNDTIRDCKKTLWLYGMAELGYALDDEVPKILEKAAGSGCDIRVLLLDPEYHGIAGIDVDEGNPPGTLASRIRAALTRSQQMSKTCIGQMRVRIYSANPTVSIVRGDDQMLVTPYLRFFVGGNSPSLELHRAVAAEMFDRYTRHFQRNWDFAKDCME